MVLSLGACGGGGGDPATSGGGSETAQPPARLASAPNTGAPAGQALVTLSSEGADWIGRGRSYVYDASNAAIGVSVFGSLLQVRIEGPESWEGRFRLPGNLTQLVPGSYAGLSRLPFQAVGQGALTWSGEGRGCNDVVGSIVIDSATYQAGVLKSLAMRFEQRCDGNGVLKGQILIDEQAMARVSPPQNPLPDEPVVSLTSDVGDYIGGGRVYAYDHRTAAISVAADGPLLSVQVTGDEGWRASFLMPGDATALVPGTYDGLTRYPFQAPGSGGMSWTGEGRSCNVSGSSMVIDSVRYEAGVLAAIDMGFEQRCNGGGPALRGRIRWDAQRATPAPGPTLPIPQGLWTSPAGALPPTGTALFLLSMPGDFMGQGWVWTGGVANVGAPGAPSSTGLVSVTENGGRLQVSVSGAFDWKGEFKAMDSLARLQVGYYGIVQRYPLHNPSRGGMLWTMDGRGCNALRGWFVVDSIEHVNDQLSSIDLRFSQYCETALAPLLGRIRWSRDSAAR